MRFLRALGIFFVVATPTANAQSIAQKADASIRRVFGEKCEMKKETIMIDNVVAAHVAARSGEAVHDKAIIHEAVLDGKVIGYGIVDDVRGKAQPITYVTLFRPDGKIAEIEVLIYREPYGGEIQYESFRRQFRGKQASSPLRVGADIENIAGATISSKAITHGAKKIAVLFDELRKAGKL
ncbi:MAG: FMN-binding protein [Bacteroidota bacterium]|nr:FMN-binding protein [Bacteroidota bacterium]MDP4233163.1 FMN-binding protein [Bacteroidota bacterium]MDP4241692.1 FMN-binding protein [Bacteroidota bacterium]MDP4287350.1 FMN-binding protein [Bacteroidota bacterium]